MLSKYGITSRVVSSDETSATNIADLSCEGVRLTCVSYLEPGTFKNARYQVRRLRKHMPDVPVMALFWGTAGANVRHLEGIEATECDMITTGLKETVQHVLAFARRSGTPPAVQPGFVGVTGLCCFPSGEMIGTRFPQDVFDADVIDLRYRFKIGGEKSGILRTAVMRQFPYPENLGKYVSESLVWNRMAKDYQTRFVNEVLTIKDYQPGGITDKGRLIQVRDTQASLLCAKELMALGGRLPFDPRTRAYSNYVRHSLHQGVSFVQQLAHAPSKAMFCLCYPIGVYLKKRDVILVREEEKRQSSNH